MELGACLPMTTEVREGHLYIGGVDIVELAHEYGTPLYVYDQADLENRMETYRDAFRNRYPNSDIVYASKAFINKAVAKLANKHDLCLDVSGGGELAIAQAAGFPAERVVVEIYGNSYPLKTDDPQHMKMLAAAVDKKMKAMSRSVRSFDERKIAVLTTLQIAEEYYKLKKDYDELVDLLDEK